MSIRDILFSDFSRVIKAARAANNRLNDLQRRQRDQPQSIAPGERTTVEQETEKTLLAALDETIPPSPGDCWSWRPGIDGSLLSSIMRSFRFKFLWSAACQASHEGCIIGAAMVCRQLLRWMISMSYQTHILPSSSAPPETLNLPSSTDEGVMWAIVLCALCISAGIFNERAMWGSRCLSDDIFVALSTTVFAFLEKVDNSVAASMVGAIQQLHGYDCYQAVFIGNYIHALWVVPLFLPVNMYLLYVLLGWPGLLAPVAMLVVQVFQVFLSTQIGAAKEALIARTDERLQRLTEALQSMRIVKFMSWEEAVEGMVTKLRSRELGMHRSKRFSSPPFTLRQLSEHSSSLEQASRRRTNFSRKMFLRQSYFSPRCGSPCFGFQWA